MTKMSTHWPDKYFKLLNNELVTLQTWQIQLKKKLAYVSCMIELPPQVGVLGGVPSSMPADTPSGGGIPCLGTSAFSFLLGTFLKSLQISSNWYDYNNS
jgi:hypothetical protein